MNTPAERAPERSTGGIGRLPQAIMLDKDLSVEARALLAYRSMHADGPAARRWGCNHREMQGRFRRGWSLGVFKAAVTEAVDAGHLERRQGKRQGGGRGRGFAVDRLTFAQPEKAYVVVEGALFNGSLAPLEVAAVLYLRIRGSHLAEPWQVRDVLGVTAPTANACLANLMVLGIVANQGTLQRPRWGLVTIKNPTLKKATFKKTTLKKTTHTRKICSPHQSVPHTGSSQHEAVDEKKEQGTDEKIEGVASTSESVVAGAVAGSAIGAKVAGGPTRGMVFDAVTPDAASKVRFTTEDLAKFRLWDANIEELFDRAVQADDRLKSRGKAGIGSYRRYMLKIAADDAAERNGVPVETAIALGTGNKFQKEHAQKQIAAAWSATLDEGAPTRPEDTMYRHPAGAPEIKRVRDNLLERANKRFRERDPAVARRNLANLTTERG